MPSGLRFAIFTLISVTLVAYLAVEIVGVSFDDRYELSAVFDDVSDLEVGDDVRVSGVPVGSVESIDVVLGRAEVGMSVSSDVELPADTTASIGWVDVVEIRAVDLTPGEATTHLAAGDTIDDTRSTVAMGDLIDRLGPFTRTLDPGQLNLVLEAMVTAFDGNESQVTAIVGDVSTMLETVSQRDATIGAMIDDYGVLLETLSTRDDQIQTLIEDLTVLTGTFASNVDVIETALTEVSSFAEEFHEVLVASEEDVGAVIDHLATALEPLADRTGDLDAVLRGLPPVIETIYSATDDGDFLTFGAGCIHPDGPPCPYATQPDPDDPFPPLRSVAHVLDLYLDGVFGRLFYGGS